MQVFKYERGKEDTVLNGKKRLYIRFIRGVSWIQMETASGISMVLQKN